MQKIGKRGPLLLFTMAMAAAPAFCDDLSFNIDGKPLDFHAFVSQGFLYTNHNNFLTMDTTKGSFNMTDGAINATMQITDKFRVGAQAYDEKIGILGRGAVTLDWAFGDYRFKDWFGVRAGKVKTSLGLYNDTQDMEFIHTFALMPQGIYPTDLRETYIAHEGVDIYGSIPLPHSFGTLSYTGYVGKRPNDPAGGYAYALAAYIPTVDLLSYTGRQYGGDVRWDTPIRGLLLGVSHMGANIHGNGALYNWQFLGIPNGAPFRETTSRDFTDQFYVQYQHGRFSTDNEYRRYWRDHDLWLGGATSAFEIPSDSRSWYDSIAYRVSNHLELGTYYSRYYADWNMVHDWRNLPKGPGDPPYNHIFDWAITGRIDINPHWNVKLEEHFMDGYGSPDSVHGFYAPQNPLGFARSTSLFMIRTGINL